MRVKCWETLSPSTQIPIIAILSIILLYTLYSSNIFDISNADFNMSKILMWILHDWEYQMPNMVNSISGNPSKYYMHDDICKQSGYTIS